MRYPRLAISRPLFALHLFRWPGACLRVISQLFSPFIIVDGLQENHYDDLGVLQCSFRIEADSLIVTGLIKIKILSQKPQPQALIAALVRAVLDFLKTELS